LALAASPSFLSFPGRSLIVHSVHRKYLLSSITRISRLVS
jgi:hypothetical protein